MRVFGLPYTASHIAPERRRVELERASDWYILFPWPCTVTETESLK
jgi:hypothetical protein